MQAAEVSNLYTAQVPWNQDASNGRAAAYRNALAEVLIRVTGRESAARDPELLGLFERPSDIVSGYRPGPDDTLWVSFDGREIQARLRAANQRVWGDERPLSVVWLVLDRGRGNRDIVAASDRGGSGDSARSANPGDYLRERLEAAARRRGLPLVFPLMDATEQNEISAADIRGDFVQPVMAASQRYGASSILLGTASTRSADLINWTWYFGGERREFQTSVEGAAERMATSMADLLAISDPGDVLRVRLEISNMGSVAAYGSALRYLGGLPQVQAVDVLSFDNGLTEMEVQAIGSVAQLKRAIAGSGLLAEIESSTFSDSRSDDRIASPADASFFGFQDPRFLRFRYTR